MPMQTKRRDAVAYAEQYHVPRLRRAVNFSSQLSVIKESLQKVSPCSVQTLLHFLL